MSGKVAASPTEAFLAAAQHSQCRVGVVTRHLRGVRGVISGTVQEWDKHMNMLLKDCQESYSELHAFRCERTGRVRRKQKHFTRRMKHIFLKGDSVVLVHKMEAVRLAQSPEDAEGAAACPAPKISG